jgi:DNA-binding transcriptional LysR family regulator
MDVLNYMRLFVEVAKRKSFRAAAEALDMPNSTLSRNIAELEKTIGLRLLHRSTRKVELTEAGEVYFKRCQNIVEEALGAHQALLDVSERPIGTLRVSTTSGFAVGYLAPILSEFANAYPLIKFDFDLSARRVDLQADPFDVAIRLGPAPTAPSTLVARQIASIPRYLYASPAYLEQAPRLQHANDLVHHVLIVGPTGRCETEVWRSFRRGEETVDVMGGSRFVMNSADLSRAAAANGIGITDLDSSLARQDVAAGRLRRVLPDWEMEPTPVHIITDTRHLPARTKLFIAFVIARLAFEAGPNSIQADCRP